MNDFAHLISELDRTNKTNHKVDALVQYFNKANNKDKVWAIALFSHRRPKRLIKTLCYDLWRLKLLKFLMVI